MSLEVRQNNLAILKINPGGQRWKQRNRLQRSTQEVMVARSKDFPDLTYWVRRAGKIFC